MTKTACRLIHCQAVFVISPAAFIMSIYHQSYILAAFILLDKSPENNYFCKDLYIVCSYIIYF